MGCRERQDGRQSEPHTLAIAHTRIHVDRVHSVVVERQPWIAGYDASCSNSPAGRNLGKSAEDPLANQPPADAHTAPQLLHSLLQTQMLCLRKHLGQA